jgi:uncharacterized membrane-anchored protein
MITKQSKFILAVALQVMIIFAIIFFKVSILTSGTDVLLKIAPVDPRDMLRGDYVTFRYDISDIDQYLFSGERVKNGSTVYVLLAQRGKYYTVGGVRNSKPNDGSLFIKGTVIAGGSDAQTSDDSNSTIVPSLPIQNNNSISIVYGIEEYFIPEGKGLNFSFFDKEAGARVAVDENGNAVLKQIYVDDKIWP